jgi:hypothetical protein
MLASCQARQSLLCRLRRSLLAARAPDRHPQHHQLPHQRTRASSMVSGASAKPASAMASSDINTLGGALLSAVRAPLEAGAAGAAGAGAAGTFVSPISVSLALVLLLNGAREGTAVHKQLLSVLAQDPKSDAAAAAPAGTAAVNARYEALLAQLAEGVEASRTAGEGGGESGLSLGVPAYSLEEWAV